MSVILYSAVVPNKSTLLSVMLNVGQHKHAFPTFEHAHCPTGIAPEAAAPSPDAEALHSTESRPALTAEPHGQFNEKIIRPQAPLSSAHCSSGRGRGERPEATASD